MFNASSWVASKLTGHATPLLTASSQVLAHTHQRSPGFKPGKLNCGAGVIRSFPFDLAKFRNASVTIEHTTWRPRSLLSVLQHPSLYQPVNGSMEHSCNALPRTFTLCFIVSRRFRITLILVEPFPRFPTKFPLSNHLLQQFSWSILVVTQTIMQHIHYVQNSI